MTQIFDCKVDHEECARLKSSAQQIKPNELPLLVEIEAKWVVESEQRIDAVDRGELTTVDGPSALRSLRSSLEN